MFGELVDEVTKDRDGEKLEALEGTLQDAMLKVWRAKGGRK